jgi:hypothetical protein
MTLRVLLVVVCVLGFCRSTFGTELDELVKIRRILMEGDEDGSPGNGVSIAVDALLEVGDSFASKNTVALWDSLQNVNSTLTATKDTLFYDQGGINQETLSEMIYELRNDTGLIESDVENVRVDLSSLLFNFNALTTELDEVEDYLSEVSDKLRKETDPGLSVVGALVTAGNILTNILTDLDEDDSWWSSLLSDVASIDGDTSTAVSLLNDVNFALGSVLTNIQVTNSVLNDVYTQIGTNGTTDVISELIVVGDRIGSDETSDTLLSVLQELRDVGVAIDLQPIRDDIGAEGSGTDVINELQAIKANTTGDLGPPSALYTFGGNREHDSVPTDAVDTLMGDQLTGHGFTPPTDTWSSRIPGGPPDFDFNIDNSWTSHLGAFTLPNWTFTGDLTWYEAYRDELHLVILFFVSLNAIVIVWNEFRRV